MKSIINKICTSEVTRHVLYIYAGSFVLLCLLIANPGYFSHDELQRFDFYVQHGLASYFRAMLNLNPGTSFATPMRPFAFFIQGLQNLFMHDYPVVVHLSSALVTATIAVLVYAVATAFGLARSTGLLAAFIFIFSPLSVQATGWSAALMDQWFVLWGLLCLLAVKVFLEQHRWLFITPVLISAFCLLALLSKETAIIWPGAMLILVIRDFKQLGNRRLWMAAAAWALPVLVYLGYRLLAIKASLATDASSPYSIGLHNVLQNMFVYFAFPFVPKLGELQTWVNVPDTILAASLLLHVFVIAALARLTSLRLAGLYVYGYFLFLLPVLLIPNMSSHYLFGSALVLAVALAYIVCNGGSWLYRIPGWLCIMLLAMHSLNFQQELYQDGTCMARLAASSESLLLSNGRPQHIQYRFELNSPAHVLLRYTNDRNQIGLNYPVRMTVLLDSNTPPDPSALQAYMNKECIAVQQQAASVR